MAKTMKFFNLTGGLNTEQGLYTINSTENRTESPDMKNIEYYKLSGLKVQPGNILLGNLDSHTVIGGYEYHKGNNYYLVVGTNVGDIYLYDDEYKRFNNIFSYGTVCERLVFCNYADGLVIANGKDNLVYYVKDREEEPQENLYNIKVNLSTNSSNEYIITRALATTINEMSFSSLGIGDRIYIYNNETDKKFNTPFEIVKINTVEDITKEKETLVVAPVGAFTGTFTGSNLHIKLSNISVIGEHLHNTDPNNTVADAGRIVGSALANYKGRIWVANPKGGIYYSELGNIHGWDIYYDAGVIAESEEDKSFVTALGIWSEYLVVHKKQSSYLLNATDDDSSRWEYKPYTESTCRGPYSYSSNDRGYYLYSDTNQGVYPLLSRSVYNTTYMGKELSYKIRSCFNKLDTTKQDQIFVAYDPVKQYMCFYMNMLDGNGYSNKCYIYCFLTQSWLYREVPQNVTIAFSCNNKIYIGTYEGDVLEEFSGTTFNGEPIPFYWTSPEYVWGGGTNKTTTREARFKLSNEENNNFYVESILDGYRTSKRNRKININSLGKTLVWDIGYNKEDKNSLGRNVNVYKYQDNEHNIWYSLYPEETVTTKINIPMYQTSNCSDTPKNNQDITYRTSGTINNYTDITYDTKSSYSWQNQNLQYKSYVNTSTLNGRFIAWIKDGDTTGKCQVNLTTKTEKELEWVGFGGPNITSGQRQGYSKARVPASFYNNYWNTPNAGAVAQLQQTNGNWSVAKSDKGESRVYSNSNPTGGVNWFHGHGHAVGLYSFEGNVFLPMIELQDRIPSIDGYKEVTKETSNGKTNSEGAVERRYTRKDDNTIVIKVNGIDLEFNRNTKYDYGNPLDNPKYTDTSTPSISTILYNDSDLTSRYGTVTKVGSNYVEVRIDNNTIRLYRKDNLDSTRKTPIYWADKPVTFESKTYEDTGQYYKLTFVGEQYPDDNSPVWLESITDTTFDNDLWSGAGYITKRCILSNQYFETIQYKISGEVNGSSLCLAGFEIDGIQITEVPH